MIDFKRALSEFELEYQLKFLKNTRRRKYVEARSAFFHYLRSYCNYKLNDIKREVKENTGWDINHATILHALNNYEIYIKYEPSVERKLQRIIDLVNNENDKAMYIRDIVSRLKPKHINMIQDAVYNAYDKLKEEVRNEIEKEELQKELEKDY